ncbi:MAG: flagellar biosynthesis protein FlhG [Polaribacter sp.]|jgi:flagellar biosynthesis protein FlhG
MFKTEWGLDILPSASDISQQQPLLAPSNLQVRRLIEKLIYDYDVVLIDTVAGIDAIVQNYLDVADQALLVINSEPASLTDGFGLVRNLRNVQTSYNIIINRIKDEKIANDIYKRFAAAVKKYIGVKVERLGYIQAFKKTHLLQLQF